MISKKQLTVVMVCLALVLLTQASALACPTCKEGLAANDPAYAGMVRGYFFSIIFMMSMPFLTLAGIAGYFYYEVVRARRFGRALSAAAA